MENKNKTADDVGFEKHQLYPENYKVKSFTKMWVVIAIGSIITIILFLLVGVQSAANADENYIQQIQEKYQLHAQLSTELITKKRAYEILRVERDRIVQKMQNVEEEGKNIKMQQEQLEQDIKDLIEKAAGLLIPKQA